MEVLQLLQQALAKYLNVEQRAHRKKRRKKTSAVPYDETIIYIYKWCGVITMRLIYKKYISLKIEFY